MTIRIVTASAGSGKTYRLTEILDEAIGDGSARPEGVVAVTFTNQAAAELVEKARGRLLTSGRALEAHRLLAARIGTVNAVCGALVADFAFELGISPSLRVLDEAAAELEFRRAVGRVVSSELADELERFRHVFEQDLDWRFHVRRVVEAARANGIDAGELATCAARSKTELDACLGPVTADDLDLQMRKAISSTVAQIEPKKGTVKKTQDYLDDLRSVLPQVERHSLRWGDWAKLAKQVPAAKLVAHAEPVQEVAARHVEHPRLRADLHRLIDRVFEVASRALAAYQAHKRALGVIDFVDQETYALALLRRHDVCAALKGQIDLFLVDEFQDTSPIQLAVFLELASLAKRSIWVGDPKQAIYGFRGTDPALMDAAIESLTSVTSDGDLVAAAADALAKGEVETLGTSYRSRPGLVALTSEVFARAFETQGIPEKRTRLEPALKTEPRGLGEIVEHWPLKASNAAQRANATATGVRGLVERKTPVRDRSGAVREASWADVAILCRTNQQCRDVAAACGELGVPAVVPRTGLLDTLEALVVLAGLTLWVDPRDAIAAAELARIITYPDDLDGFVGQVLTTPGRDAFAGDETVARVHAARAAEPDLGPLAAVDAVLAATEVRRLCAEWGDAAMRLGNLDALRAHAVAYVERAASAGEAPTVVGLLAYLGELAEEGSWKEPRTDDQALLAGEDAVTISTWHAAKGLEWPVTVLFGLESPIETRSWGVHVMSAEGAFDLNAPLAGRWIRFWPNPYTNTQQKGPLRDAAEASASHGALCARAAREALRVLYVGWTRARDRLVFAAAPGKLLTGIVGTLTKIDEQLISEPPGDEAKVIPVTWAGVKVKALVVPVQPAEPMPPRRVAGEVTIGNDPLARAPAHALPSEAAPLACTIGHVEALGPRLQVTGSPDMEDLGHAVHAFLAADRPGLDEGERITLAEQLLAGFGVGGCLDATEVVGAAKRLWAWCDKRFPGARLHREWPVARRDHAGTLHGGTADLVLTMPEGFAVIDHKTFPGDPAAAPERAKRYSGQLAAYADAISAAVGAPGASTWIHFPVLGVVVEVRAGG